MKITFLDDAYIGATPQAAGSTVETAAAFGDSFVRQGIAVELMADGIIRSRRGRPRNDTKYVVDDKGKIVLNDRDAQTGKAKARQRLHTEDMVPSPGRGYEREDMVSEPDKTYERRDLTPGE